MEGINEAFEIVFGKEFVDEMASRLFIIACALLGVLFIIFIISVWKSIANRKIKKAILALSEYPDDEQAEVFIVAIDKVSSFGKFLANHSKSYSGLSKGDCRIIYNSTVLTSNKIGRENKIIVRRRLMKVGCTGLTDVNSI